MFRYFENVLFKYCESVVEDIPNEYLFYLFYLNLNSSLLLEYFLF